MEITVLIAEDEENIRKLVANYLSREGYRVIQAEDGQQAVEQFEKLGDTISLVILDIMMPHMDGYEACRKIRELSEVPMRHAEKSGNCPKFQWSCLPPAIRNMMK